MRYVWLIALMAGCSGPSADDSCDPDNNEHETAGCACEVDEDCTCQVFTGAAFEDRATTSACGDDGACIPCLYL